MPETFKISCGHCGHTVQVDQRAIGKEIPCQRCGKRFLVAPPAPEFISVSCTCGKQYKVPASQAGKRAKCNACGTPLVIPQGIPKLDSPIHPQTESDSKDIDREEEGSSPSSKRIAIIAGAATFVAAIIILSAVLFSNRTNPAPVIVQTPTQPVSVQRPQPSVTPASRPTAIAIQQPARLRTPIPTTSSSTPSVDTIVPTPSATTMPAQADVATASTKPSSFGEIDEHGRAIGKPREVWRFEDTATSIRAVAFAPNGKLFATCGRVVTIWELPGPRVVQELSKGAGYPSHVCFSQDSSHVLWNHGPTVCLTEVSTGRDIQQFSGKHRHISAIAISPNGKIVATTSYHNDETGIQLWDVESGSPYVTLSAKPPVKANTVAFSPGSDFLLSDDTNGRIHLWDVKQASQIRTFVGHKRTVQALAWLPDGKSFVSGGGNHEEKNGRFVFDGDNDIRLWNINSTKQIKLFTGHKSWIHGLAVTSNGQYLISSGGISVTMINRQVVTSEDNSIRVWNISTGQEFQVFQGHQNSVSALAISSDGHYALSGSTDQTARLWLLPEEVWEDRPADAVVISERRNLRAISRRISGEVTALIAEEKWDEAVALLNESESDLTELAQQNNLPLWDTTISPLFRLIESKHTAIGTKRPSKPNAAEATSRPATRLTAKQNRELAEVRTSLAQIEILIREKKLLQAQKAVYKAQDELKLYAKTHQIPEWATPLAVLFQNTAKWQDEIEEARTANVAIGQDAVAQAKTPANASAQQQQPQTAEGLQPGQQAPGFTALTLDGGQFATQQFKGKYVLLDFWATWCGPCKAEMPYLADVYQTYGKDKRFVLISLSMDSQIQTPAQYAAQNGMKWIQGFLGSNSQVTKLYQVSGIPSIILIGPDGKVLATRLRGDNIKKKVAEVLGSNKNKVGEVLGSKTTVLHVDLSLEDRARAPIKITSKDNRIVRETNPGRIDLDLSSLPQGNYHFYFGSPGYASQWTYIVLPDALVSGVPRQIELFRERYVVMRYVFNKTGGRSLVGDDVENGRAAVSHWGSLEFFGGDWQVWQSDDRGAGFGKIPYLQFHRYATGFGFLEPPRGRSFDELKEAAELGYQCQNVKAVKGTVLLCRVNGNKPEGLGYGKIMIEDVTETPPRGVTVIQSRAH